MTTPVIKNPIKIASDLEVISFGEKFKINLFVTSYIQPPGLAVMAILSNGAPFGKLSVSIPESSLLPDWAFFAKAYSENEEWAPQVLHSNCLFIFKALDISAITGKVTVHAWQLRDEIIELIKQQLPKSPLYRTIHPNSPNALG